MPSRISSSIAEVRVLASAGDVRRRQPRHPWLALVLALTVLPACAYRFTNKHIVRPEGIRTIAVEAVYDTSREVLPHELLWESLQEAFATNGHLRLAPQSDADALVRAHIRTASVTPAGVESRPDERERDPEPFEQKAEPPRPSAFRKLSRSREIRDSAAITMVVEVEVWNLRTRTQIMRQSYPVSDVYRSIYNTISTKTNDHLRFEEATVARFKALSDGIARNVVRDLLVR